LEPIMSAVPQTPPRAADGKPAIQIKGLNKWYGEFHVLKNIDLTVARGEKIVVCGPSGSGKSTLIRCINRLEQHQQGSIVVNGIELTDDIKNIDTIRSDVGMVFQHFNLFPHLTVLENCTLAPIWVRKQSKAAAEATAMKFLERVRTELSPPSCDVPVVFVTGHGDVPMAVTTMKKGAMDFIEKPFKEEELLGLVERMLDQARDAFSQHQEAVSREALLGRLTTREAQVLERIVAGRLNKQIADDLGISIKTVEAHRANIMEKLNANTVADLLKIALGAVPKA
jgi:FixJ family two-component response regulator